MPFESMFAALELTRFEQLGRVIDPPRGVLHWRGTFRSKPSGEIVQTDVLDIFLIKDGRVSELTSFFDTAFAAKMMERRVGALRAALAMTALLPFDDSSLRPDR